MAGYEKLLAPGKIGSLELPNRILMSPMGTEMCAPDGKSTPQEAAYYAARARGGTGLVLSGVTFVQDDLEPIADGLARLTTDAHISGVKAIADAVHAEGGRFGVQLTAGLGRNVNTVRPGTAPVSPSDNTWWGDPNVKCRPMTLDEIHLVIRRFGEAARRAHQAGVDVIDIHGHTGYLIDQFCSAVWNRRTDEFGGSVENRARFAVEIVKAVKANAPGLPVTFRLSVDHLFPAGRKAPEAQQLALELQKAGVDFILADNGSYEAMDYVFPPYYLGDACMVSAARALKQVLSIPVGACGNLTPELAEKVLADGDADFVALGRPLIADPDIARKLREGRASEVRPCIRCNQLCTGNAFFGKALGCAVNPEVGFEATRKIERADKPKKIAVVGAGPAGLEAARVAALRGHAVEVFDKNSYLGGVLWPAATPDFKRELRKMIGWWERELAKLPVKVHLGAEITADSEQLAGFDEIVVAAGSHPLRPRNVAGLDSKNVVDVIDFHLGAKLGQRVVVAGGGLSGCDAALEIAEKGGHDVTIVEMLDEIARDMLIVNRITLLRQLAERGGKVLTGRTITAIEENAVIAQGPNGREEIPADTVIAAFGVCPATELTVALTQRYGAKVHPVGDCVQPRKVGEAVNDAYALALTL
ncbi:MAG: FAD-dependent oxidoreductase [Myxococcales bacterium]